MPPAGIVAGWALSVSGELLCGSYGQGVAKWRLSVCGRVDKWHCEAVAPPARAPQSVCRMPSFLSVGVAATGWRAARWTTAPDPAGGWAFRGRGRARSGPPLRLPTATAEPRISRVGLCLLQLWLPGRSGEEPGGPEAAEGLQHLQGPAQQQHAAPLDLGPQATADRHAPGDGPPTPLWPASLFRLLLVSAGLL